MLALLYILPAAAQTWQIGGAVGYGIYRNGSIYAPAGKAVAGFRNRFAVSALLSEEATERISGEVRYTYQDGDPFLSAGAVKTNVQGSSHALHYDVLIHLRERGATRRPYLAVGAGGKWYVVSGPSNPSQPLSNIARLTTNGEAKPLFTVGGGLKLKLKSNFVVQLDFRDYITPFPSKLIRPAPFGTARGILHQFTPLAGLGYTF